MEPILFGARATAQRSLYKLRKSEVIQGLDRVITGVAPSATARARLLWTVIGNLPVREQLDCLQAVLAFGGNWLLASEEVIEEFNVDQRTAERVVARYGTVMREVIEDLEFHRPPLRRAAREVLACVHRLEDIASRVFFLGAILESRLLPYVECSLEYLGEALTEREEAVVRGLRKEAALIAQVMESPEERLAAMLTLLRDDPSAAGLDLVPLASVLLQGVAGHREPLRTFINLTVQRPARE